MAEAHWLERDFYADLGLTSTATADDVTKAYRKLAKQLHPDSASGDEARFKEIAAAYEVLGNEAKRAEYDALRSRGTTTGSFDGFDFSSFTNGSGFGGFSGDLSDLLGGLFSAQQRARLDVEVTLRVGLLEADAGGAVTISWQGEDRRVSLPAGVATGARLRVAGRGRKSESGAVGDLYLNVQVEDNAVFTRQGDDLVTESALAYWTCVNGGEVVIEGLRGPVTIKVPMGVQSGAVLRVKGQGMAKRGGGRGNLLVIVSVQVPKKLTASQREALVTLEAAFSPKSAEGNGAQAAKGRAKSRTKSGESK